MSTGDRASKATFWGIAAGITATGTFATWPMAVGASPALPIWPTYAFGGATLVALYLSRAVFQGWPPFAESGEEPPIRVGDPSADGLDGASSVGAEASPEGSASSVPAPELTPVVTDRWHHASNGGEVPEIMIRQQTIMSHTGYRGREWNDQPPSIRVGMVIGCQQIDPSVSGTEPRAKFVAFLNSAPVRELIGSLTHLAADASWTSMAGNGVRTLEAVLTTSDDPEDGVPVASALFLPAVAEALYGRPERTATLLLYVEPRTADGKVPPASELVAWYRRIDVGLAIPGAFAEFLSKDLGLGTFGDPRAQFGVWLESHQGMTAMVSTEGLRTLPGSSPSNQFIGYAYADPDGKSAGGVARDMMVQMCEHTLKLNDYESALPDNLP